jgi:hypothetical protein
MLVLAAAPRAAWVRAAWTRVVASLGVELRTAANPARVDVRRVARTQVRSREVDVPGHPGRLVAMNQGRRTLVHRIRQVALFPADQPGPAVDRVAPSGRRHGADGQP